MNRTHLTLGVLATLLIHSVGCATVSRGKNQVVKFVTEPPAAKLVVDGHAYITPAEVTLKRKEKKNTPPHDITVSKEGYQSITFKLKSHWDGGGPTAVVLDAAVPGGSAMFLIDMISGADHKYSEIATIKLLKQPPGVASTQPLTLYEYKGKLLEKADYDAAVEKDKLFKDKKKKGDTDAPTTKPAK